MEREQKKSGGWIVGYIVAVPATAKRAGAAGNMGGDAHATNTDGCPCYIRPTGQVRGLTMCRPFGKPATAGKLRARSSTPLRCAQDDLSQIAAAISPK